MSKESAAESIRLPTVSEIEAATERLSMSDAYDQVFRVGERFAVKSGYGVPLIEAETMNEKATICKLIKDAICKLRSIPSPDYFGMLNREPYLDGVFWTADYDPKISGPFANQEDLNLAIIERLRQTEKEQYISIVATYD
ncbi:hypothetical protein AbraIFM66951_001204 [Aspergillus brasiliensis]|uniref:Uncharacterized protein n=1 Tax=Aspergillus brasiliensis TaxID=319629 RepID=A0A9W5YM68_9EURO|nr:hypothetical protein AbraCBS73388_005033 [Aspergillus brasiliensis]GKZ48956.1 hypothetical protein AbraIFM66951_001204 [Aspergillus brasiliensis]